MYLALSFSEFTYDAKLAMLSTGVLQIILDLVQT
jgi:hypothetical protein